MTKIIAISNPKGGVGKTTTVINLAASLAIAEKKVLIIDIDPASAVSAGLGIKNREIKHGIFDVYSHSRSLADVIIQLNYLDLDVVSANVFNSEQEIRLAEMAKNRIQLRRQLRSLIHSGQLNYDFILIDTPPALNDLTIGALLAADSVLIPLQCGYYSIKAVGRLIKMIERIKKSANSDLEVESILLNFYEKRTRVSLKCAKLAEKLFVNRLSGVVIPKNAVLGYSAFQQRPIALVDATSTGARAYLALAKEVLDNNKKSDLENNTSNYNHSDVHNIGILELSNIQTSWKQKEQF